MLGLGAAVDVYLARRRAAGFQLVDQEGMLRDFVRFASTQGDVVVQTRTVPRLGAGPGREPAPALCPTADRRALRSLPPRGGRAP